ncbi:MAG TPA: hypothetical protein VJR02_20420 [Pyrinomonadaceae bacterium]|nr:hypothetical protein [Pyrinomonadaceae bacterium]
MNDNIDVLVHLGDGRVYSFIVSTPNNIFWCMENEKLDYYFGIPPVFVANLTSENIERALKALVSESEGDDKWLRIYGALQQTETDE